jgi:hypothetical protein
MLCLLCNKNEGTLTTQTDGHDIAICLECIDEAKKYFYVYCTNCGTVKGGERQGFIDRALPDVKKGLEKLQHEQLVIIGTMHCPCCDETLFMQCCNTNKFIN